MKIEVGTLELPDELHGVFAEWTARFPAANPALFVRQACIFALSTYALGRDFNQSHLLDELLYRASDLAVSSQRTSELYDLTELCLDEARVVLDLAQRSLSPPNIPHEPPPNSSNVSA